MLYQMCAAPPALKRMEITRVIQGACVYVCVLVENAVLDVRGPAGIKENGDNQGDTRCVCLCVCAETSTVVDNAVSSDASSI